MEITAGCEKQTDEVDKYTNEEICVSLMTRIRITRRGSKRKRQNNNTKQIVFYKEQKERNLNQRNIIE